MFSTSSFIVTFMTIACPVIVPSAADAWTRKTPSLPHMPGGYVYCRVLATSTTPIRIVADVVGERRAKVTEFGYGSRMQTAAGYTAEETAGSSDGASAAHYCKVTVDGARRKDVVVLLTSYDGDGGSIATVAPR